MASAIFHQATIAGQDMAKMAAMRPIERCVIGYVRVKRMGPWHERGTQREEESESCHWHLPALVHIPIFCDTRDVQLIKMGVVTRVQEYEIMPRKFEIYIYL